MAWSSEAAKKAYEADIARKLQENNRKNGIVPAKTSKGANIQRSEADRLMHYNDARISERGAAGFFLLGIPLLIIPPVGLVFIAFGIISLFQGRNSSAKAAQR